MDDGPDDDSARPGPPLPPDDRLWRHPSEMGAASLAGSTPGATSGRAVPWATAGLAALVGAAATIGVVMAMGGVGDRVVSRDVVERVAVAPVATLPVANGPGTGGVGGVAAQASPAIARLEVAGVDQSGAGSGVLFRSNGYLLTSAHVVESSESIDVVLASGDTYEGDVIGADPLTDIAVVKIDGRDLPTAVLGSAEGLTVGEPAVAIGSLLALRGGPSVTAGVISALGRTVVPGSEGEAEPPAEGDPPAADATVPLHDMIQTDAPIAAGSSGGALLDRRGSVVGITTAVGISDVGAEGLGFATPIDIAHAVADDIIITGHARHPWLGIEGADVDAATAEDLGVAGGALVRAVDAGSPADVAGLDEEDVITAIAGVGVATMADLVVELRRHDPGETVPIDYLREGDEARGTAHLAERSV